MPLSSGKSWWSHSKSDTLRMGFKSGAWFINEKMQRLWEHWRISNNYRLTTSGCKRQDLPCPEVLIVLQRRCLVILRQRKGAEGGRHLCKGHGQGEDAAAVSWAQGLQAHTGGGAVKGAGDERKMCSGKRSVERGAASTRCAGAQLCPKSTRNTLAGLFSRCWVLQVKRRIPAWELGLTCDQTICTLNRRSHFMKGGFGNVWRSMPWVSGRLWAGRCLYWRIRPQAKGSAMPQLFPFL